MRPDGSAVCWGGNEYGQATPPTNEPFVAVSAGAVYTCALRPDGSAACWGSLDHEHRVTVEPPSARERFTRISVGNGNVCAIRTDGAAVCWGDNRSGQAEPPQDERFAAISVSPDLTDLEDGHACALRLDGSAVCWGDNRAAHRRAGDIDADLAQARLWDVVAVLDRIGAKDAAGQVREIRRIIAETTPTPSAGRNQPVADAGTTSGAGRRQAANGLKPWMAVAPPNDDVRGDTLSEADFAASLQDVHSGRADETQYGNPISFFEHTYITPGMKTLLLNALRRFAGSGGDPVIQTRTGFGGGKTHSLIALYHLIGSTAALAADKSPIKNDIRALMEQAGVEPTQPSVAHSAVLDGTWLAKTDPTTTEAGDPLNTLWGEMAHQLGGQEAYDVIGEAARGGTAPGGKQLEALFRHIGEPCAILIDEPVAYVRNLAPEDRDRAYTFFQALTQAVRGDGGNLLVVSLPDQVSEAGAVVGLQVHHRDRCPSPDAVQRAGNGGTRETRQRHRIDPAGVLVGHHERADVLARRRRAAVVNRVRLDPARRRAVLIAGGPYRRRLQDRVVRLAATRRMALPRRALAQRLEEAPTTWGKPSRPKASGSPPSASAATIPAACAGTAPPSAGAISTLR